ncbi:flagellin [Ampullimonas aquatilis]|uniref:flagellin N-terminal helical domain-containing protein n=1 Tax=Ampullimonas aquatilis TaxID=1341549 RepID=UPI003C7103F9
MALTVNTNLASLNAQRNLMSSQSALSTSYQRLSSGLRVNSAKDDAAGLAIADRMNTQVKGMNVAIRNANDAVSLAQTAEGGLANVTDALQRMRELAVQSANATNGSGDRANLDKEFKQMQAEITRLTTDTKFNGTSVLKGGTQTFQVGADVGQTINIVGTDLSGSTSKTATSAGTTLDVTSVANATAAIAAIDSALDEVNTERANYGASQNRFDSVISNLKVGVENQSASRSRIMDADFAAETANLSRNQVLQQAGTAMLAQANQSTQNVLSLLR